MQYITEQDRQGSILDIGCGQYPTFLSMIDFHDKYGCEPSIAQHTKVGTINIKKQNGCDLDFENQTFNVVTMLAVIEHVPPEDLWYMLSEVRRVLVNGGKFIITTPSLLAATILPTLGRLRIISAVEIDDHKTIFTRKILTRTLRQAGFKNVRVDYYESFMNLRGCCQK